MSWAINRGPLLVRPTRHTDIEEIGGRLRKADVAEVWAATHLEPMEALVMSRKTSTICQTVVYAGNPVAIFGCGPDDVRPQAAEVWLLATDDLYSMRHAFLRGSRECVSRMLEVYPLLINWVDARNIKSIEWLKWLGAKIMDAKPYGPDGLPFHFFTIKRSDVNAEFS